jgi:tRNA(Ser,Leu) C12 N-acetylase TAN1
LWRHSCSRRFYPGETLRVETWRRGEQVQFRTRVVERDIVVLSHGGARIER